MSCGRPTRRLPSAHRRRNAYTIRLPAKPRASRSGHAKAGRRLIQVPRRFRASIRRTIPAGFPTSDGSRVGPIDSIANRIRPVADAPELAYSMAPSSARIRGRMTLHFGRHREAVKQPPIRCFGLQAYMPYRSFFPVNTPKVQNPPKPNEIQCFVPVRDSSLLIGSSGPDGSQPSSNSC